MHSNHLRENDLSYAAHLRLTFSVASRLAAGAIVAAIHELMPEPFNTRTSEIIAELHRDIERHRRRRG